MRKFIIGSIGFFLVLITVSIFLMNSQFTNLDKAIVQQGDVDLTAIDQQQTVNLDGTWSFYPNELLMPAEVNERESTDITVPNHWASKVEEQAGIRVATYRTKVRVAKDGLYSLRFHGVRHATRVFINSEQVAQSGNPTINEADYTFTEQKFNATGQSEQGILDIVVQVAYTIDSKGGIVKPVTFGHTEQIERLTQRAQTIDGFIVASYFMLAFIFIFFYTQRKRFAEDLLFAVYCFAIACYSATQNEKIIFLFFPNLPVIKLWNWQFFFIHSTVLALLWFAYKMFPYYANKITIRVVTVVLVISLLIFGTPFPSVEIFNGRVPSNLYRLCILIPLALGSLYVIVIIARAIQKEKEEAMFLLTSLSAFICYGLALNFEWFFEVNMGYWPVIVLFIMNISIAFFIGYRHGKAYRSVQELTQQLFVENELKDELLLKVSLELEKPLKKVYSTSQKVMKGSAGPLTMEQQELTQSLTTAVKTLGSTVQNFHEASQSNVQQQFSIKPTSLQLYNELIYELSFFISEPNDVKMYNNIPPDLLPVLADEKRLRQVLVNVIQNSMQFTQYGTIVIDAFVDGNDVCLTVQDTGIGIEVKHISKLFDAFYQVKQVGEVRQGVGIGLSVANQFLKLMNGSIDIQSSFGVGTTVCIRLPKAQVMSTQMIYVPMDTPLVVENNTFPLYMEGTKSETVVVIDQDETHLLKMVKSLVRNDYNVYAYNNCEDVLSLISNNRIDLIVVDVNMPNKSVVILTTEVRQLYHSAELPIILLSQTDRMNDMSSLFNLGINDILRKPIVVEEFMSHINSLLTMKKAVQQSIKQELNYYYAQITPHFLYNTLNSIIGLSYSDVGKMREALEHLSIYFRAKLDYQKHQTVVPIEDEFELVRAYLAIEQLRFEQLQIELDIDESIELLIPAMTVQPLVENAIHHGLKTKKDHAKITISLKQNGDVVEIVIADNGVGMPLEKQTQLLSGQSQRLGFLNPFEKIKLMKHSTFHLSSKENEGTTIKILLRQQQSTLSNELTHLS